MPYNTFICVIKYSCRVYIVDSPKHSVLIHYTSKGSYVIECVQFSVCDYSKPNSVYLYETFKCEMIKV